MAEQGARVAMAERGARAAMAEQGARVAMAERGARAAMAGKGTLTVRGIFSIQKCCQMMHRLDVGSRSLCGRHELLNQIKSNHFYCHITTAQVPW